MNYLPKDATIEQSCAWLQAETGQTWILPRLMECHLTPYFWLDYKPGYPRLFGDRLEGYQTRMVFQGDLTRLESDGGVALVTMFTAHDDVLVKVEPGWPVPLSELRFKREAVERVAEIINRTKTAKTEPEVDTPPAPVVEAPAMEPVQWKMRIQIEAAAHIKTLRAAGASPTPHSILDRMVTWCRDNKVMTDGDVYPSAGYLRTHVLGGKHWMPPR